VAALLVEATVARMEDLPPPTLGVGGAATEEPPKGKGKGKGKAKAMLLKGLSKR